MDDAAGVSADADAIDAADAESPTRLSAAEATDLVVRTIQAHAASLLRLARRYSLCADDAQDAYQRALEVFLRRASSLDPERAPAWLHTVIKHEAMAVRQARLRLVGSTEADLDAHEARDLAPPDERLLSFEHVARCAEALQRLKPQEAKALWLQASGRSYTQIAQETGWSATKVNRCLTEGRRSFVARYASIESGAECDRWAPVVCAIIDGEASREQITQARPHLRNCPACRAMARDVHRQRTTLRAIFPIVALGAGHPSPSADPGGVVVRLYEAIAGALHERAAASVLKAQALLDATSAGKVAAAAASAAALAGGGIAVVDHAVSKHHEPSSRSAPRHERTPAAPSARAAAAPGAEPAQRPRRQAGDGKAGTQVDAEFALPESPGASSSDSSASRPAPSAAPWPGSDQAAGEFGP